MNRFNQILSLLAASSLVAATPQTGGRPSYPYKLATTKAERMDHVKRRQASNKREPYRKAQRRLDAYWRNQGPSRKMFVPAPRECERVLGR